MKSEEDEERCQKEAIQEFGVDEDEYSSEAEQSLNQIISESQGGALNGGEEVKQRQISIKHKLKGPKSMIPKKLADYMMYPNRRTAESYEEAKNAKYGVDDYLTVRIVTPSRNGKREHILNCDSRTRIDKLIRDIARQFRVELTTEEIVMYGGKRLQPQKPDAVLRDLAYKQFNEGADIFTLELKFVPIAASRQPVQTVNPRDAEMLRASNNERSSRDPGPSYNSSMHNPTIERKEQNGQRQKENKEESIPIVMNPVNVESTCEMEVNNVQSTSGVGTDTMAEFDSQDNRKEPSPMEDDEMPSLTMEAPGGEEAPVQPISYIVPKEEVKPEPSLLNPPPPKQARRGPRAPQSSSQVTYHQLPFSRVEQAPPLLSLDQFNAIPRDEKIRIISMCKKRAISSFLMLTETEINTLFLQVISQNQLEGHYLQKLQQRLHEAIIHARSMQPPHNQYSQNQHLQQLQQLQQIHLLQQSRARKQINQPRPNLPGHAYTAVHSQMTPSRNVVPIMPNMQLQRTVAIPESELEKLKYLASKQMTRPTSMNETQSSSSPNSSSSISSSISTPTQPQNYSSGVKRISPLDGNIHLDPCDFRPDPHQKSDNKFLSVSNSNFEMQPILWEHHPRRGFSTNTNVLNTVVAINEFIQLSRLRHGAPGHFLEPYYLAENFPSYGTLISAVDYNMFATRRRCDHADVKISRLEYSEQTILFALKMTMEETDEEKWKELYRLMGWSIETHGKYPIPQKATKSNEPELKRKSIKNISDILLNKAQKSEHHSPTSSEASSTSPSMTCTSEDPQTQLAMTNHESTVSRFSPQTTETSSTMQAQAQSSSTIA